MISGGVRDAPNIADNNSIEVEIILLYLKVRFCPRSMLLTKTQCLYSSIRVDCRIF